MADGRDFGTLISERRLALGYSLGQLANRVRATASEVRAWERGDRAPGDDIVAQLAAELALDADELAAAAHDVDRAAPADTDEAEPTAVVMSPAAGDSPPVDLEAQARQLEDVGEPAAEDGEERLADQPPGGDTEPTAQVAAGADETPRPGAAADDIADQEDDSPIVLGGADVPAEAEGLADLPTQAVPVVAAPAAVAVDEVVAVQAPSHPVPQAPQPKAGAGTLDPVTSFLRVLFDPDRRYLFWVRTVLIFVVFLVFLRVLAWAVPAFFDTLRDILDTIESTTTDTTLPGG